MNLTGQLLISMPSLEDERFFKTVIYMCAHSKDGAMGIIINKKIDYDLYPDLLEQLGIDKPLGNKKLFIRALSSVVECSLDMGKVGSAILSGPTI